MAATRAIRKCGPHEPQFIHDNWLSNRVFKSYEDILDHCFDAGNSLIEQPWKIMSIGTRERAHRC